MTFAEPGGAALVVSIETKWKPRSWSCIDQRELELRRVNVGASNKTKKSPLSGFDLDTQEIFVSDHSTPRRQLGCDRRFAAADFENSA